MIAKIHRINNGTDAMIRWLMKFQLILKDMIQMAVRVLTFSFTIKEIYDFFVNENLLF